MNCFPPSVHSPFSDLFSFMSISKGDLLALVAEDLVELLPKLEGAAALVDQMIQLVHQLGGKLEERLFCPGERNTFLKFFESFQWNSHCIISKNIGMVASLVSASSIRATFKKEPTSRGMYSIF